MVEKVEKIKVKQQKVQIDCPTEEELFREKVSVTKYQIFKNWCAYNGIIGLDRVSYPHRINVQFD